MSMTYHAVTQTISAGNHFDSTVPATTAAVSRPGTAVYPSADAGGMFAVTQPLPPSTTPSGRCNPGVVTVTEIRGDFGDATTLNVYKGLPTALSLVQTVTLSGGVYYSNEPIELLEDEVLALTTSGGAAAAAKTATVITNIPSPGRR